jgi:PAS domain S-box-containing protein
MHYVFDGEALALRRRPMRHSVTQGIREHLQGQGFRLRRDGRRTSVAAIDAGARMECWSMDTQTGIRRITARGCTASALQMCPDFIENLPVAVYACDMRGRIVWFNARAVALWGRTPRADDDVEGFGGTCRFEGRRITPEETPMSAVLKAGISIHGVEGVIERPDGSRIWTMAHIGPLKDESGHVVGAINCFHETTEVRSAIETLE